MTNEFIIFETQLQEFTQSNGVLTCYYTESSVYILHTLNSISRSRYKGTIMLCQELWQQRQCVQTLREAKHILSINSNSQLRKWSTALREVTQE